VRLTTTMRTGGLATAATVAHLLSTVGPAIAAPADPISPGEDQYVSLGSSFAAGPGLPLEPNTPAFCARSTLNYAHLVARELDLHLTDASCTGATVDNVVDTSQAQPFVPSNTVPAQISTITPETDLVTVTAGGNDVDYLLNLFRNSCQIDPVTKQDPTLGTGTSFICTDTDPSKSNRAAFAALTERLIQMVETIQALPGAPRIVLVDYFTILPQNGKPCAAAPTLTREEIRYSLEVARQLQLATKHAAQRTGVELVELSKASRHHDVCSADPWVNGWVDPSNPTVPVTLNARYHPNAAGMQAAAELIIDQLT
jgi:lysophospholipase L1-like esterase